MAAYTVLYADGSGLAGVFTPIADKPFYPQLKEFVLGILREKRKDAELEHVAVLHEGKRCSMFVDEDGIAHGQPINQRATTVYWAASTARGEPPDPVTASRIHGTAILFDRNMWE